MIDTAQFAPWDDPDARPLIQLDGVTKRFGDFTALDALDLAIYPREFFALLGPSGCGKTTLMRLLGGFETLTEGQIHIDGQDMAGVPANKRAVNMMFQSYALFPHLSVADNIAFGLKRSDMPKSEIGGRVDEMLRLVQLEKFARRKPHQLSGGQKQRVALARALAKSPKLLLLDEPLGALDKKLRQQTQFELMDIQEKTGTTFVIVTHDQEEAMTMASRIAVMNEGRLMQVATPEQIYETPASTYVADFIGDVNILSGTVTTLEADRASLTWAEGQPPITGIAGENLTNGGTASCVIRPEKVKIGLDEPINAHNKAHGTVEDIAYLGHISIYHVRTASGALIKAQTPNAARGRGAITWEQPVWLSWHDTAGIVLRD